MSILLTLFLAIFFPLLTFFVVLLFITFLIFLLFIPFKYFWSQLIKIFNGEPS